jgi:hypothetical protein
MSPGRDEAGLQLRVSERGAQRQGEQGDADEFRVHFRYLQNVSDGSEELG